MFVILKIFSDAEVTSIIFSLYFFIDLEVRISKDQSFEIMGKITAKKKSFLQSQIFLKPYIFNLKLLRLHRHAQKSGKRHNIFNHIFCFYVLNVANSDICISSVRAKQNICTASKMRLGD